METRTPDRQEIERELDKLQDNAEAKADMSKLNPYDLARVGRITFALYNVSCSKCQALLYAKRVKKFSDMCDKCRDSYAVRYCFERLQDIYRAKVKEEK